MQREPRGQIGQSVRVGDRVVLVRETADGELTIEVTEQWSRSLTRGVLPTDDTPIGAAVWDEDGLVASVGPAVESVRVTLTDGTMLEPELREVENSAAQYVIVPLSPGVQPKTLTSLAAGGIELATNEYRSTESIRRQRDVP